LQKVDLVFHKADNEKHIKDIHEYNIDAFSDSPDFNWTLKEIKNEVKDGWELYGAYLGEEIIAAIFMKEEQDTLLSKNTAIKMSHQGSGYSHMIKEFIEKVAREKHLKKIAHYCRIDNFRMYSLNESHGYKKTPNKIGPDGQVVEWIRDLSIPAPARERKEKKR
jgi:predicted GNAT family acetyltransferase